MPNWRNFNRKVKPFKYPVRGEPGYCTNDYIPDGGHGYVRTYFRAIGENLEQMLLRPIGPNNLICGMTYRLPSDSYSDDIDRNASWIFSDTDTWPE